LQEDKEGRFEREQEDFFRRVAEGYTAIARREMKRVAAIDAKRNIDEVHSDIVNVVKERLPGVL
jgi:dTMP kinase